jgi:hypothetical protein
LMANCPLALKFWVARQFKWNVCGISRPCYGRHGLCGFGVVVHGLQCQKCRQWIGGSHLGDVGLTLFCVFLGLGERSCFLGGSKHYFFSTGRSIVLDR